MHSTGFFMILLCAPAIVHAQAPSAESQRWLDRGSAELAAFRYKEAAEDFERAVSLNPDSPQTHIQLSRALLGEAPNPAIFPDTQGYFARAEAEARKAVKVAPHDPDALAALATVLGKLSSLVRSPNASPSRNREAIDLWRQVAAADPHNALAHAEQARLSLDEIAPVMMMARMKSGVPIGQKGRIADPAVRADLQRRFGPAIEEARRQAETALSIDQKSVPGMQIMAYSFMNRALLDDSEAGYESDMQAAEDWSKKAAPAAPHPPPAPLSPAARQGGVIGAILSQVQPAPGVTNMIVALPDAAERNLLKRVDPVYPEEAKQAHVEGKVHFRIQIDPDGRVIKAEVVSGDARLARAATEAVRKWLYKPFHSADGTAIYVATEVTVEFKL